jgi:hypothetical protein
MWSDEASGEALPIRSLIAAPGINVRPIVCLNLLHCRSPSDFAICVGCSLKAAWASTYGAGVDADRAFIGV